MLAAQTEIPVNSTAGMGGVPNACRLAASTSASANIDLGAVEKIGVWFGGSCRTGVSKRRSSDERYCLIGDEHSSSSRPSPATEVMAVVPVIWNVGLTGNVKLAALATKMTCSSIPRLSPIILWIPVPLSRMGPAEIHKLVSGDNIIVGYAWRYRYPVARPGSFNGRVVADRAIPDGPVADVRSDGDLVRCQCLIV